MNVGIPYKIYKTRLTLSNLDTDEIPLSLPQGHLYRAMPFCDDGKVNLAHKEIYWWKYIFSHKNT